MMKLKQTTVWLRFIGVVFKAACCTVRPNDTVLQIRAFIPAFIALGQRAVFSTSNSDYTVQDNENNISEFCLTILDVGFSF